MSFQLLLNINTIVKALMMKKLQIVLLLLLTLGLVGCGHEQEKNTLQAAFDQGNKEGNTAICVASGVNPKEWIDLRQPYITYDITPGVDRYKYLNMANEDRKERLAVFADLGLLNQQALPNGQYRYTPTEEGLKYIDDDKLFCFGRVVINDIKYEKKQDGMTLYTYRYYLENVPDWAKNKLLDKINTTIGYVIQRTAETKARGGWFFSPQISK